MAALLSFCPLNFQAREWCVSFQDSGPTGLEDMDSMEILLRIGSSIWDVAR